MNLPIRLLTILALMLSVAPTRAIAIDDDGDEGLVCAAIHPCNPDGSVIAPFDRGACGEVYRRQCAHNKHNDDVNDAMFACESENQALVKQIKQLTRKLRSAKRR